MSETTDLIQHESGQLAEAPGPTALLSAITRAAADPAMDIEKVERLFAMHQKVLAQQAETEFNAAKARAQSKMETVARNAANTHTGSSYANLAAITQAIQPVFTAEGFSLSFDTGKAEKDGDLRVIAILSHRAGHTREYHLDMPPDATGSQGKANKTAVQATGSTNSYARRYLTCMIWNVTTQDDTDGNREKAPPSGSARGAMKDDWDSLSADVQKEVQTLADCIENEVNLHGPVHALKLLREETQNWEVEMKTALQYRFSKDTKRQLKTASQVDHGVI